MPEWIVYTFIGFIVAKLSYWLSRRKLKKDSINKVVSLWAENQNLKRRISMLDGIISDQYKCIKEYKDRPASYSIVRTERTRIAPSVKNRLLRWYSKSCAYCGVKVTRRQATIDHIIPIAMGGSNHISNLCISCDSCNKKKGDSISGWHPTRQPPLK